MHSDIFTDLFHAQAGSRFTEQKKNYITEEEEIISLRGI